MSSAYSQINLANGGCFHFAVVLDEASFRSGAIVAPERFRLSPGHRAKYAISRVQLLHPQFQCGLERKTTPVQLLHRGPSLLNTRTVEIEIPLFGCRQAASRIRWSSGGNRDTRTWRHARQPKASVLQGWIKPRVQQLHPWFSRRSKSPEHCTRISRVQLLHPRYLAVQEKGSLRHFSGNGTAHTENGNGKQPKNLK